jgi:hypothetical protein
LPGCAHVFAVFESFQQFQIVDGYDCRNSLAPAFKDYALSLVSNAIESIGQVIANLSNANVHRSITS